MRQALPSGWSDALRTMSLIAAGLTAVGCGSSTETFVVPATTSRGGSAQVVEQCAFCNFHNEYTKTLPRIQQSSSSGGSSGGGSSFGGGRSGGGGASRGY